jgi:drug/metabolite transporter (DMT)-like permease
MSSEALLFVLCAALAHAAWNLQAKRAGGGAPFVWAYTLAGLVLWAPFAALDAIVGSGTVSGAAVAFMLGSGVLHSAYFLALQRGYRHGDLSVVYPLARGTGPLGATIGAIVVLGERPSPLALAGAGLIIVAVLGLGGDPRRLAGSSRSAAGFALLTGALIAVYTLWDAHGVTALGAPPVLYFWVAALVQGALLAPLARRRPGEARRAWREHRPEVLSVAVLSPLAYVLVLFALRLAPVFYVAPAREASIVVAAALGTRLLGEGDARRRMVAASAIVVGIAALAVG